MTDTAHLLNCTSSCVYCKDIEDEIDKLGINYAATSSIGIYEMGRWSTNGSRSSNLDVALKIFH